MLCLTICHCCQMATPYGEKMRHAIDCERMWENATMHQKSREFCAILDEMREMHLKKASDYGTALDPISNLRASDEFGVEPWLATMVRLNDKVTRLKTYAKKRSLRNESLEDNLIDLACYSILVLILFRETLQPDSGNGDSDPDGGSDDIGLESVHRPVLASDELD